MTENITPDISPNLIRNVSSIYTDPYRVLMEYIDNSLDACEPLFDINNGSYKRKIAIELKIEGDLKSFQNLKITISDNSGGIDDLSRIVTNIGNSNKKGQPFLNGQFGYGIYSFLAICKSMEVITNYGNATRQITITSSDFAKEKLQDIKFKVSDIESIPNVKDGTRFILSEFEESRFNNFSTKNLQKEIESHFELLLSRANQEIKIAHGVKQIICKPFDYSAIDGSDFKKELKVPKESPIANIEIYLRFTKGRALDRPPVFISRKRRINLVKDVKLFDTNQKSTIWGHPNVTGYIDTGALLSPTLSRKEYKESKELKLLFKKIRSLEPDIEKFVKDNAEAMQSNDFSILEDKFNSILSTTLRTPAKDCKIVIGEPAMTSKSSTGPEYIAISATDEATTTESSSIADVAASTRETAEKPGEKYNDIIRTRLMPLKGNRSAFRIKIEANKDPPIDSSDNPKKSVLDNNTVVIFKKHAEFKKRIDTSRSGIERISSSLSVYLIGEVLYHYYLNQSDVVVAENTGALHNILSSYTNNLYKLDLALQEIIGKNIDDLS